MHAAAPRCRWRRWAHACTRHRRCSSRWGTGRPTRQARRASGESRAQVHRPRSTPVGRRDHAGVLVDIRALRCRVCACGSAAPAASWRAKCFGVSASHPRGASLSVPRRGFLVLRLRREKLSRCGPLHLLSCMLVYVSQPGGCSCLRLGIGSWYVRMLSTKKKKAGHPNRRSQLLRRNSLARSLLRRSSVLYGRTK